MRRMSLPSVVPGAATVGSPSAIQRYSVVRPTDARSQAAVIDSSRSPSSPHRCAASADATAEAAWKRFYALAARGASYDAAVAAHSAAAAADVAAFEASFAELQPILEKALAKEGSDDAETCRELVATLEFGAHERELVVERVHLRRE